MTERQEVGEPLYAVMCIASRLAFTDLGIHSHATAKRTGLVWLGEHRD
jgi:hypothetical protein